MRRIGLLTAALFAVTLHASPQTSQAQPPPQPPPVFRAGTNLVQVDAIVTDPDGHPLVELTAADFELQDDGKPMTIDRVRFLGAEDYSGDSTPAPIRTHDDEEREASRDDVRVYAIMLDDYHVQRMEELRVIEPLLAFVRQLPPTDLVAVYYPLDSVTDVAFTRDREAVFKAIRAFYGRKGDYQPKRPVEEEHLRFSPGQRETIRRQIVTSALEGLALHLGSIKIGRKTIIFVSDGFTQPVEDVRDLFQAANRTNTAIYPLDPRGLTMANGRTTSGMIMNGLMSDRDAMETLAAETGGRAIVQKNDLSAALGQVIRDSRAYYLIAYESPHPDDGKFHKVSVRVKRRGASVFARTGYWAFKRERKHRDGALGAAARVACRAGGRRQAGRLPASRRGRADGTPAPDDDAGGGRPGRGAASRTADDRGGSRKSRGRAGEAARVQPHRHAGRPLGNKADAGRFRTPAQSTRRPADRFAADARHGHA